MMTSSRGRKLRERVRAMAGLPIASGASVVSIGSVAIAFATAFAAPITVSIAFLLAPGASLNAEMRPYIPPPASVRSRPQNTDGRNEAGDAKRDPQRDRQSQSDQPRVVHAFPVAEFLAFLNYKDEQLEILSRSEEPEYDGVVLGRLKRRLAAVVGPDRRYRFDRSCPLVFDPAAREDGAAYVRLLIGCLPAHHRDAFAIRLYRGNALTGVRFASYELLRAQQSRREFIGELLLAAVDLREGFVPLWRWQGQAALSYSNALLETLRARYPLENEARLLAPRTLSANTATLLRRFAALAEDAAYVRERDLAADFRVLYPGGSWFEFRRSCPLLVEESLRREPATELYRLQLRISCLQDSPRLRSIQLLLPGHALHEAGAAARLLETEDAGARSGLAPGDRIHARLKFRTLSSENTRAGLQFLLVWDTIRDIRADLPLVPPKS